MLPLKGYDGIIGMDWLSSHSPQLVDWHRKWLKFQYKGAWVCLQGKVPVATDCNMLSLQLIQPVQVEEPQLPIEVQDVLQSFQSVFKEPEGLPPRRVVSHAIPLIEGARPVQIRPYRLAPELKDEVEKKIQEMLTSGVIRPSTSSFASPLILVKKKDKTWRPCVDFHQLNALTIKSK